MLGAVTLFQDQIRTAAFGLTPSDYMTIDSMRIADVREGDPILLEVRSTRKRNFTAVWQAQLSRWEEGAFRHICGGSNRAKYSVDSDYRDVVTLEYWIGATCPALGPGRYRVGSAWTVLPGGPVIAHQSETFSVF